MGEIDKGAIYLAFSGKSVAGRSESSPSGGRLGTLEEEARTGAQLKQEYADFKRPRMEASARVFQAMSVALKQKAE